MTDCFGFSQVAITLRRSRSASENDWGGLLYTGGQSHFSRTYRLQLVDRVGGGDSFAAGLIYALLRGDDAPAAIEFAAAASALKQSIPGDFNRVSVPEVERLSQGDTSGRIATLNAAQKQKPNRRSNKHENTTLLPMPPKTKAPKSPRQCVSNSEAASGLLTSLQGTDARTNLPGTLYSVRRRYLMQPRRAPGRESVKGAVLEPLSRSIKKAFAQQMPGAGRLRTARPPPFAASFFPDPFFAAEERIGPPEGGGLFAW